MWSSPLSLPLAALLAIGLVQSEAQFNNPSDVDIWCGKAYRSTNASFNPGGWFEDPPFSSQPLLRLVAKPRMSIYLDTDAIGSIVLDADISYQIGGPVAAELVPGSSNSSLSLVVAIMYNGTTLATTSVKVGSIDNEIPIDLNLFPGRMDPYTVTVRATPANGSTYHTTTDLYRLPYPVDYGSISRIDNLYGGLWVQRSNQTDWELIFPYTYYVQWSLYWDSNVTTIDEFAAMGYNMIHIVPTGTLADTPFPWEQLQPYLDRARELGLFLQYDVIWSPTNDSSMIEQVTQLRTHPSILVWYQSDEADGKSNPINSTGLARDAIWQLDPYHPSSLALNCYDFYYADYARGGEIIISDVYPISTNTSWSTVYETPCNATYGCCGCDDCHGAFEDISDRIDEYHRRDSLLGWQKTQWAAPQAFGNETFWTRYPTAAEEVVMAMLAVNHGAKGLVAWNYPTSEEISTVTQLLAAVLTNSTVASFLLQTPHTQSLTFQGGSRIDAAAWVNIETKNALLSVINLNYGDLQASIQVALPNNVVATGVAETLWGDVQWTMAGNCTGTPRLSASTGLLGLQVSLVVLDLV